MGEDKLKALLQESLAVATRTDAMKPSDLARVVIDTTVQSARYAAGGGGGGFGGLGGGGLGGFGGIMEVTCSRLWLPGGGVRPDHPTPSGRPRYRMSR